MARSIARVKDQALIIDARTAKRPGVVRLGLADNPYLAFSVQSDDEGSHLGYAREAGGPFQRAASFADRAEADRLLTATLQALAETPFAAKLGKRLLLGVAIAVGLCAALFAINGIALLFNRPPQAASPAQPAAEPSIATPPRPGTPADADSLLQPPS